MHGFRFKSGGDVCIPQIDTDIKSYKLGCGYHARQGGVQTRFEYCGAKSLYHV